MSRAARRAMVRRPDPELSLSRQCRLLSIGRSWLYYTPQGESAETLARMRRIDELFLKHPFYGARQIVRHLRREGVRIGRRRAGRLMRLMGLQAIYRAPRTSEPHPEHRVYPYLNRAGPCLVRRHHLHPCARGFLYLVAILDWASRYVLAWRLSNTLDAGFCVEALEEARTRHGQRSSIPIRAASSPAAQSSDGRPGPVHGQHLHRAAVLPQIRDLHDLAELPGPARHRRNSHTRPSAEKPRPSLPRRPAHYAPCPLTHRRSNGDKESAFLGHRWDRGGRQLGNDGEK